MIRFNLLHPPFNNQKMRQALLYVVNQKDYVIGIAGDPKNGKPCYSFFTCGTPLATEVGAEPLKGKRDLDKAKQLIKEVRLQGREDRHHLATDQPIVHAQSLVTLEMLKKLGLNVELQAGRLGHADHAPRGRRSRSTRAAGTSSTPGWSGPTWSTRRSTSRSRGTGEKALVRLADRCEARGAAHSLVQRAPTPASSKKAADAVQKQRLRVRAVHPDRRSSSCRPPIARTSQGVIIAPIAFLWNVEKK